MEVIELLKQLAVAVPSILVGTQVITAAVHGAFSISNPNTNHAVSWIVAILAGLGFVQFNGLEFGLGDWDYLAGAVCGLLAGGAANGFYDWPSVSKIFDAITRLFSPKTKSNE